VYTEEPTVSMAVKAARHGPGPERGVAALRVLGLEKTYRSGLLRRRVEALRGVSFAVERGQVFALLGHNGAGKTTTLLAVLDLLRTDAGAIEIFGRDHRDPHSRRRLGYLPEAPYFAEHLNGRELLDFHGRLFGLDRRTRRERSEQVLELVGLCERADLRLRKYSKGMRQRIGLAQALLNDADLLILDEPTSGLDPLGRHQVRELLRELRARGKTIVFSSHIVPDVEVLADVVGILRQGQLVAVHDLAGRAQERWFEVVLTALPQGEAAQAVLAHCAVRSEGGTAGQHRLTVPDLTTLRRLLAVCEDGGLDVRRVTTRERGLEEIFLASLQGLDRQVRLDALGRRDQECQPPEAPMPPAGHGRAQPATEEGGKP
jgi:ABC-2 type transport system ATP-binding protein